MDRVTEYKIIYPRGKHNFTRTYVNYPFVLSYFQQTKIRTQRYAEMTEFIRKISLVHHRLAEGLKLPTPILYK